MLDVSEAIAEQMAGRTVRWAPLIFFDFLSGPRRVWQENYPVTSGGHTWDGVGPAIVSIDPGTPSKDGAAEPFAIGVSGVEPAFIAKVRAAESESIGRTIAIYLQFFTDAWQPLDGPIQLRRGRMVGFSFSGAGDKARSIIVRAEGSLVARGRPINTFLSDAEQQARFPGDLGCAYLPSMQHTTVVFPK